MIELAVILSLVVFGILYTTILVGAIHQENEISLPSQYATRMNIVVVSLSLFFAILMLAAFFQIDWNNILVSPL